MIHLCVSTSAKGYYPPNVEIKYYNVKINGENFVDKPIKNNKVTYENIRPGTATLMISNYEMNDILKIVKSLKSSGVLLKGFNETINNEAKKQKGGFFSMLLDTLGASLLGNM